MLLSPSTNHVGRPFASFAFFVAQRPRSTGDEKVAGHTKGRPAAAAAVPISSSSSSWLLRRFVGQWSTSPFCRASVPSFFPSFSRTQRCRLQQHSIRAFKGAPKRELELETAAKAFEDNASKGESTSSFSLGAAASPLFPLSSSFSSFPPLSFVHFRPSEEKKRKKQKQKDLCTFSMAKGWSEQKLAGGPQACVKQKQKLACGSPGRKTLLSCQS